MTEPHPPQNPFAEHRRRPSLFARTRANFLTGLIVVLPVGLTIWLIWAVIGWVDAWVLPLVPEAYQPEPFINRLLGRTDPEAENWIRVNVRGIGVVLFLVFTGLIGWMAKGIIGRSFIAWGEGLVDRMPVVRSIYNGLKQIAETVFSQGDAKFDKACLVEYPRKGAWVVAFVSSATKGEIAQRIPAAGSELVTVFMPTTPNPTTGFLFFVPRDEIILLDMSLEDAAKLIISAGLVYPGLKESKALAKGENAQG